MRFFWNSRYFIGCVAHVSTQLNEYSAMNILYHIIAAHNRIAKYSVTLVAGGAVLGFDDQVHIDLDRSHTVLSPDEARQFSAELKRIADEIETFSDEEGGE